MGWDAQHRGDFLNMPFRGTLSGYWSGKKYYTARPKIRAAYRQAVKDRGYTRIYFDIFKGLAGKDYFGDPAALLPVLDECVADGLGPVLFIIPEGDKSAQAQYGMSKSKVSAKYLTALRALVKVCGPCVADWIIGVEVDEVLRPDAPNDGSEEDDAATDVCEAMVTTIGQTIRSALKPAQQTPIWVHWTTGWHGTWGWWRKQAWATPGGLCFQYDKADKGGGFLASDEEMRDASTVYSGRLKTQGGGRDFLAGEYAWQRPEAKGRARGKAALEAGAVGAMNGC